jgi:hypothetical protein
LRAITKANEAARLMREEGLSLSAAARAVGTDKRTLRQNLQTYNALERIGTRRYRAGHLEGAPLLQQFLHEASPGQLHVTEIAVGGQQSIADLGEYWSAISRYASATNIREAEGTLDRFAGREVVDVFGKRWAYVTDRRLIQEWLRTGDDVTQPIQSP